MRSHYLEKNKNNRVRIVFLVIGILLIVIYRILALFPVAERATYLHVVKPIHQTLAGWCDVVSFSIAEIIIGAFALGILIEIIQTVIRVCVKRELVRPIGSLLLTLAMWFAIVYGGFCILWGVYYSASDIEEICGIHSDGVKHEDLIEVDRYFVNIANEYSERVARDSEGVTQFGDEIFDRTDTLYDNVSGIFPGLKSNPHKAKRVFFSEVMSYIDFTGFFFPYTAEANINVHSPDCMIPATIAHELAHQRGIAAEDEANFVAILTCMEDGNPEYVYSASLLALVYLQNAVYKSGDKDTWREIRDTYSKGVVRDLDNNSRYWDKYRDSATKKVANNTHDAFLKSYDQDLGIETYGACVDLLVEYYR